MTAWLLQSRLNILVPLLIINFCALFLLKGVFFSVIRYKNIKRKTIDLLGKGPLVLGFGVYVDL